MNKIIVRLFGGLGNQLFQYAFARAYAARQGKELVLDDLSGFGKHDEYGREFVLDQFRIKEKLLSQTLFGPVLGQKEFWGFLRRTGFVNKEMTVSSFNQSNLVAKKVFVEGYWQSPLYFEEFRDEIKKSLSIKMPFNERFDKNLQLIRGLSSSVAIGIRFFQEVTRQGLHEVLDEDYYRHAILEIKKMVTAPHFIVFSNDAKMAANLLRFEKDVTVLDPVEGNRGAAYDLYLMTQCQNFIISNSTFHWWGAYLGENENSAVVAPQKGYYNEDMMRKHWLLV